MITAFDWYTNACSIWIIFNGDFFESRLGWLNWNVLDWIEAKRCDLKPKLTQCVQVWETRKKTGQPQRYCSDGTHGNKCQSHQQQLNSRPRFVWLWLALYGENKVRLRVRFWQSRWAIHAALESFFLSKRHSFSLYFIHLFCLYVNITLIKTGRESPVLSLVLFSNLQKAHSEVVGDSKSTVPPWGRARARKETRMTREKR